MQAGAIVRKFPDEGNGLVVAAAREVADEITKNSREGRRTVLGLPTGNTPLDVYRELIRLHKEEGLDFSNVVTFNLDEYYELPPSHVSSYHQFMWMNFFSQVNIREENVHIPDGTAAREGVEDYCKDYEKKIKDAGGLDLVLLGIGRNGHIGFNEPGSARDSRTRLVELDETTRRSALSDFGEEKYVPKEAITMGIATIMEAKKIILMATGEHKAGAIQKAVEGEVDERVAASILKTHKNAHIFVDKAAASQLASEKTPWRVPGFVWSRESAMKALCHLSEKTGKPMLKVTRMDCLMNRLASLYLKFDFNGIKAETLEELRKKIVIDGAAGHAKLPVGKTVLVFSPHPDDDIISMGGTLRKLVENGNRVIVAYMTPGYTAVFDHAVLTFVTKLEMLSQNAANKRLCRTVRDFLGKKAGSKENAGSWFGMPDIPEVLKLKAIIRQAEAISTCEYVGVKEHVFLNLPFYQTGRAIKLPVGEKDVVITLDAIGKYRPDHVFAAGDLTDPNGAHRLCLSAIRSALGKMQKKPDLWLYSGAWSEFHPLEANVLVPLSENDVELKKLGIFRHQSQKDTAPLPGHMKGEFWERASERNAKTAALVAGYGAGGFHAMEAFKVERR
jgi:glucosamine-6-phosphate deaminase